MKRKEYFASKVAGALSVAARTLEDMVGARTTLIKRDSFGVFCV